MNYIKGFLPWLVYGMVATRLDWRYGALVGLGCAVLPTLWDLRRRKPVEAMVLQLSAILFFTVLTLYAMLDPGSPLRTQVLALAVGWLAVTAWGSLLVRRPFTAGIAKQMIPPGAPVHPRFFRVNVVITCVWAASFTVEAATLATLAELAPGRGAAAILVKVLGWAVPMTVTLAYAAALRRRGKERPGQQATAPDSTPASAQEH